MRRHSACGDPFPPRRALGFAGALLTLLAASPASAQKAPEAGYVWPPGARAGTTVEVRLGGYDWTPDLQLFLHDARVKLEVLGPQSPIYVPPPPYWFGPKSFSPPEPIGRELPVRLTLPPDLPPGPLRWQVANANGASGTGVFWIGEGPEAVESEGREGAQRLDALPVTVSGRLFKIAEVDRYRFTAPKTGPISCALVARRLGTRISGVIEVRDVPGRLVADAADTEGEDAALTFAAQAGREYEVAVHDVDFRGDRSFVYRLELTPGPRVLAALPAAGRRGETREVELRGIGVATGKAELESVTRRITFPSDPNAAELAYHLETPFGTAPAFPLLVSDIEESRVAAGAEPARLAVPGAVSGTLERRGGGQRLRAEGKKGERWRVSAQARRLGSPLDVALAVLGPDGKELARADDAPGTTDATLDLTLPTDGAYTLVLTDGSGRAGDRAAVYRVAVERPGPGFSLRVSSAQAVSVPLGEKAELTVTADRTGGFDGPIALRVEGLPPGYTVPESLVIPAGQKQVKIPVQAGAGSAALAALVRVRGTAKVGEREVEAPALATAAGSLAARSPEELLAPAILVAGTLKPPWKITPADKDGGRTVSRGAEYPAEVLVDWGGYAGPLALWMAGRQDRHRQGITGPELPVPAGAKSVRYPCFMPEWLETSRTSRMALVAVGQVRDPQGNLRYLLSEMDGKIVMSIEGALLKVHADVREPVLRPGGVLEVPITLFRAPTLSEPVRVELVVPDAWSGKLTAEPLVLPPGQDRGVLRITTGPELPREGEVVLTVRATTRQEGKYRVQSEAEVRSGIGRP